MIVVACRYLPIGFCPEYIFSSYHILETKVINFFKKNDQKKKYRVHLKYQIHFIHQRYALSFHMYLHYGQIYQRAIPLILLINNIFSFLSNFRKTYYSILNLN